MLDSINWPNSIVLLSLILEILINMCMTMVCEPSCDVMNFETNQAAFRHKQKARQKLKYLENQKSF